MTIWEFAQNVIYLTDDNHVTIRSVHFFPRVILFYFLAFHIYLYSIPYGFFDVALIPWILGMIHAMIFTIISLELPAWSRGAVSMESPREVYSKLSWPEWSAGIPQDWTLFLPLNSRYIPMHDRSSQPVAGMQQLVDNSTDGAREDGDGSEASHNPDSE
jgi:hypothetical protein